MVDPYSCDNKAISAPAKLELGLGLSLAINKSYPLHTSSKYLPVTYQTHIKTLSRQPTDTLKTPSRRSQDTLQNSLDTLKILPMHPLFLCVQKRWAAGGWVVS